MRWSSEIRICSVCDIKHYCHGYCKKHYHRWRVTGDPLKTLYDLRDINYEFWSRVSITADPNRCWEWQGSRNDSNYGRFWYRDKGHFAHRTVWFLTYGHWPRLHVLHHCDNPPCVNPRHLYEGTPADNNRDKALRGRCNSPKGERNNLAKLKESQVLEIRKLKAIGVRTVVLAERFDVSDSTVRQINARTIWKHI